MRRDPFQAIADPTRRAIITLIAVQTMTPNALAEHFSMSRQAVSKHIRVLSDCQLLKQDRAGREIHYYLDARKMKEIADWLDPFRQLWENRFNNLDGLLSKIKMKS